MGMHTQGDGGKKLYLNVSCGKLVNKKANISAYAYTGKLEKIEIVEDEFEGKKVDKVRLYLKDDKADETCLLTFAAESQFALTFFNRVSNVKDFDKQLTIGVSGSDQNEKISFCWMKQGEVKIEKNPDYIKPTDVKVGKDKFVKDWTGCLEQFQLQIEKINAAVWTGDTDTTSASSTNQETPSTTSAADDDLPF